MTSLSCSAIVAKDSTLVDDSRNETPVGIVSAALGNGGGVFLLGTPTRRPGWAAVRIFARWLLGIAGQRHQLARTAVLPSNAYGGIIPHATGVLANAPIAEPNSILGTARASMTNANCWSLATPQKDR